MFASKNRFRKWDSNDLQARLPILHSFFTFVSEVFRLYLRQIATQGSLFQLKKAGSTNTASLPLSICAAQESQSNSKSYGRQRSSLS